MDDRMVTEESLWVNFLIPPDKETYHGKSLAEVCCDSLKDFNLMVRVSTEKGMRMSQYYFFIIKIAYFIDQKSVN